MLWFTLCYYYPKDSVRDIPTSFRGQNVGVCVTQSSCLKLRITCFWPSDSDNLWTGEASINLGQNLRDWTESGPRLGGHAGFIQTTKKITGKNKRLKQAKSFFLVQSSLNTENSFAGKIFAWLGLWDSASQGYRILETVTTWKKMRDFNVQIN